uniref:Candidate secreted effector n=1 Tax=Meloidogyne incognita TaxID=6306 RepID=A0A914LAD3_MELIC
MSSQMKRTISLPNKISNFFTPPSSSFNKTSNQHKITTQKQSKINNNKYLINRLPKSQSQNEGFNFVDSPGSPNSSGYASLASSSAERCNLRLTGIEEEENQMNVSAAGDYFNNN